MTTDEITELFSGFGVDDGICEDEDTGDGDGEATGAEGETEGEGEGDDLVEWVIGFGVGDGI